jgi:uncharacterized protein
MLVSFRVGNYRSFLDDQELSFVTSADHAHERTHCIRTGVRAVPRLSRASLVFGPNAGGKSNLISALSTLRELVLNCSSFSDGQFAERYTPFRFDSWPERPTEFEIEVLRDRLRYRYLVAYDAQRVVRERLLVYRTGKSQRWFERHYDPLTRTEEWAPFSPNLTGPREMWRKATRHRALFLTTAAQLDSELIRPLFEWFEDCVEIVAPGEIAGLGRVATDILDPDLKARMLSLVRAADIPIEDFRVVDRESRQPSGVARVEAPPLVEFLHSHHDKPAVWLPGALESDGTRRLLSLLGPLLRTMDTDRVLVVDDFDSGLHPLLSRFLVQLLYYPSPAGRHSQLLLTSHNTNLMDLDMLRRDEIWFVELDDQRSSMLRPLLRSSPRKTERVMKAYLRGRYGAIPNIQQESLTAIGRSGRRSRASTPAKVERSASTTPRGR